MSGWYYRYLLGEKFAVRTNSHGFADVERSVAASRPRIALIGDSTTEFWEVDEPARGQFVLEEYLGGRYEVLNMGVRAYGTDQTYLLFAGEGVRFSPDIVVYTFCVNDINDNARKNGKPYFELVPGQADSLELRNFPVETPRNWEKFGIIRERSFVYRLCLDARNQLMPGIRIRQLLGRYVPPPPHFELAYFKREYTERDRGRMDLTLALISKLDEFVTGRGMHFLVVEGIYKSMASSKKRRGVTGVFGDQFDPDKVSAILDDYCRREGIAFLSLPRAAAADGVEPSTLMHTRDNLHLDAAGVRFYARQVADKLQNLGWVE